MGKSLAEIMAALAAVEGGAEMAASLQEEITRLRNEAGAQRITKQKVLKALGLADGEGLEGSLSALTTTLKDLSESGCRCQRRARDG